MQKFLSKYFGFPLQDFVKKTKIINTSKSLEESQYWDDETIAEYQLEKLRKLIKFAKENVPYYKKLFTDLNLSPEDFKELKDINKIPILTKEIVRKERNNLVAVGFDKKVISTGKTGGTTGSPLVVHKDNIDRTYTWASYYRWFRWMGVEYYESKATLWGAKTVLSKPFIARFKYNLINFIQNDLYFNWFVVKKSDYLQTYKKLLKAKPVILKGYASAMVEFAQFLKENNLTELRPKALSTTSETLIPQDRKFLESVFKAPIYDQYGCGEISGIAYECAEHNGLHINQEHVIIQIVDDEGNEVINEKGRVIGTNLDNFVMPFIRYENGDVSTLLSDKCACGVNQPMLKNIEGRLKETIELKTGVKVHGVFFTDILYELNLGTDEFNRFQVVQNSPGKIEFRLEINNKRSRDFLPKLSSSLDKFFHEVTIVEYEKLPVGENGKFKYIINNIDYDKPKG